MRMPPSSSDWELTRAASGRSLAHDLGGVEAASRAEAYGTHEIGGQWVVETFEVRPYLGNPSDLHRESQRVVNRQSPIQAQQELGLRFRSSAFA